MRKMTRMCTHRGRKTDRGWAWVVLVSCFVINILSPGFSLSIGSYYEVLRGQFRQSNMVTSWIGSLNFAMLCAAGPVSSVLINRFSCRFTVMAGGFLSGTSIFISSFANNIYIVFATLGACCGFGLGLCYTASVVALSEYFERLRPLAFALAICGSGLGTFIFPLATQALIDVFGWQGALLVTSGLSFHQVCAGATLRPTFPEFANITVSLDQNGSENEKCVIVGSKPRLPLYRNLNYWSLLINSLLYAFALNIFMVHVSPYGRYRGLEPYWASLLLSGIGFSSTAGRLLLGILSNHPKVNPLYLYVLCCLVAGIAISVFPLMTGFVGLMVLAVIFGVALGSFGSVLAEVTLQFSGKRDFPTAYGYLLLPMAFGTLIGAPFAGWLYDVTMDYSVSIYLGGAGYLVATLIMVPSTCQSLFCHTRTVKEMPVET